MTVRFDEAWTAILAAGRDLTLGTGLTVVALRDVVGRVSLIVDDRSGELIPDKDDIVQSIRASAGPFAASTPLISALDLFDADAVFSDDAVRWDQGHHFGRLERAVVGQDWGRQGEPRHGRVALYGFKGGVGRSTATFMLARHAASRGLCVLVVDLDLESPGIGPLLQDDDQYPRHGVVDHLAEAAVGNADGLELVARTNRIVGAVNGEVWFTPAGGPFRVGYDYLARLNRAYADLPGATGRITFAQRLRGAVEASEDQVRQLSRQPDLVLLDSRAGLHDIAAVVLTQLADLNLLFATDNRHTWSGYSTLFAQWQDAGLAPEIRDRLRMVSAMTPPPVPTYLERFRDHAQECFASHLYDLAEPDDLEAFNPAPDDSDAPHSPVPIYFSSELIGVDSDRVTKLADDPRVAGAYGAFVNGVIRLVESGT
jgi:hypothetical protein